jgi:hypothetical protein
MSEQWGGSTPSGTGTNDTSSTATAAKDEASNVAQTASQSGQQVAGTAVEQGRRVADEAAQQARSVLSDARQQFGEQASSQQHKAASTLRSLGDELSTMADSSEQSGPATQLVRQASDQVQQVAGWLENRDPAGVLDEVRSFARRRPGTFLLAAAAAGLVAGRLTRGAVDERRDTGSGGRSNGYATGGDAYLRGPEFGTAPVTTPPPVVPTLPPEASAETTLDTPGTYTVDPAGTSALDTPGTAGVDYDPSVEPSTPTEREWR